MLPTFSRRHYQKIAEVIRTLKEPHIVAAQFIYALKYDNPKFDSDRFLRACTIVDFKEEK